MNNDYCPLHSFIGSNNDIDNCKDCSDLVKGISFRVCQEHYDSVTQSVYDDYQEQELAKLDSELGDIED